MHRLRRLHVLVVTSFPIPHVGGASTVVEILVTRLEQQGLLAGLISGDRVPPSGVERLLYPPFRVALRDRARAWRLGRGVDRLAAAIRAHPGPTDGLVVHAHDAAATCAALRAAPAGVRVVQTVHGPWSRESRANGVDPEGRFGRAIRALEEAAYAGADLLLPVSRGQAAILEEDFQVPPERIRVVNNGIDAGGVARLAAGPVPPDLPARFFVVPRRLTAKNGVEVAIRALAALGCDGVALAIAGSGPLRASLGALARDLGVADRTRFLGDLPQGVLFPVMRRSLGVLVPSVPACGVVEPWGLAVLEGMACGAPVIGSALGGIAEMLVDGESGYLVPPGDPAALARAMRRGVDLDAAARAAVVRRASARVEADFSAAAWFDRTRAAYEELAHGGR